MSTNRNNIARVLSGRQFNWSTARINRAEVFHRSTHRIIIARVFLGKEFNWSTEMIIRAEVLPQPGLLGQEYCQRGNPMDTQLELLGLE